MMVQIMMLMVLVAVIIAPCSGFILHSDCPAPDPCTCSSTIVFCNGHNLRAVPAFTSTTSQRLPYWHLTLANNRINSLPSNAFQNLVAFNNGHNVAIDLSNNLLTDIGVSVDAFNGIANYVDSLKMGVNRLTSLPAAVGKLTRLSMLNIRDNPLVTVDDSVTIPIGSTLRELYVSLQYTSPIWPDAFRHLTFVEQLEVRDANQRLPEDAFMRFDRLQALMLYNSTFGIIPTAVCHVSLRFLMINGDPNFTGDSTINCKSTSLHSISRIHLRHDGIDVFPTILESLPGATIIELYDTNIRSISESLVPANRNVTNVAITRSKLTLFPKALERFSALRRCDLTRNLITTLGPNSVENLPRLSDLILNGNPISSISPNAFRNIPSMQKLQLSDTKLTTIPQVMSFPNVIELYLERDGIVCDCSLQWMNHLPSAQRVRIYGTCGGTSGERISHYINETLPTCNSMAFSTISTQK